jgi:hypothetical protein
MAGEENSAPYARFVETDRRDAAESGDSSIVHLPAKGLLIFQT